MEKSINRKVVPHLNDHQTTNANNVFFFFHLIEVTERPANEKLIQTENVRKWNSIDAPRLLDDSKSLDFNQKQTKKQ